MFAVWVLRGGLVALTGRAFFASAAANPADWGNRVFKYRRGRISGG